MAEWWSNETHRRPEETDLESAERTVIEYFAQLDFAVENECDFLGYSSFEGLDPSITDRYAQQESEFTIRVIRELKNLMNRQDERAAGSQSNNDENDGSTKETAESSVVFGHPSTTMTLEKIAQVLHSKNLRRFVNDLFLGRISSLCRQKCSSFLMQTIVSRLPKLVLKEYESGIIDIDDLNDLHKDKDDPDSKSKSSLSEDRDSIEREPPSMTWILHRMIREITVINDESSDNAGMLDLLTNPQSTFVIRDLLWISCGVVWKFEDRRSKKTRMNIHNVKRIPKLDRFTGSHIPDSVKRLPQDFTNAILVSDRRQRQLQSQQKNNNNNDDGGSVFLMSRSVIDEMISVSPNMVGTLQVLIQSVWITIENVKKQMNRLKNQHPSVSDEMISKSDDSDNPSISSSLEEKLTELQQCFDDLCLVLLDCAELYRDPFASESNPKIMDDCKQRFLRMIFERSPVSHLLQSVLEFGSNDIIGFVLHKFLFDRRQLCKMSMHQSGNHVLQSLLRRLDAKPDVSYILNALTPNVKRIFQDNKVVVISTLIESSNRAKLDCNELVNNLMDTLKKYIAKRKLGKEMLKLRLKKEEESKSEESNNDKKTLSEEDIQVDPVDYIHYLLHFEGFQFLTPGQKRKKRKASQMESENNNNNDDDIDDQDGSTEKKRKRNKRDSINQILFPNAAQYSTVGCNLLCALLHSRTECCKLILSKGLLELEGVLLNHLCRDNAGSYVLQSYIQSMNVPHQCKFKLITKIQSSQKEESEDSKDDSDDHQSAGMETVNKKKKNRVSQNDRTLAHLCLNKCGNFVMETSFKYLLPQYKSKLAGILVKQRSILTGHKLGLKMDRMMNLPLLQRNPREWNDWMTSNHKLMRAGHSPMYAGAKGGSSSMRERNNDSSISSAKKTGKSKSKSNDTSKKTGKNSMKKGTVSKKQKSKYIRKNTKQRKPKDDSRNADASSSSLTKQTRKPPMKKRKMNDKSGKHRTHQYKKPKKQLIQAHSVKRKKGRHF